MRNVELRIEPTPQGHEGIAAMALLENGTRLCGLDIQYSLLHGLRNQCSIARDFLVLASAVYALDKKVPRRTTEDCWTRAIALTIPVSDVQRWRAAETDLTAAFAFLTGDHWRLNFTALGRPIRLSRRVRGRGGRPLGIPARLTESVCLFSGGLDSLAGAIDHLEQEAAGLLLMGHHDGDIAGPFADQRRLIDPLRAAYPRRLSSIFMGVGQDSAGSEITLRSRSLLFIAIGLYGATAVGPDVPLLVPENGTIALNFPLTPSRRGSCSTRTAHPYYLETLGRALRSLGIGNSIVNPLAGKTKGEVVGECANLDLLVRLAPMAVSCAKRSRRMHWRRRNVRSCGQCMPCVYRRAALHRVGADIEVYGNDICAGEVDVFGADDAGKDFRACLSLLRRRATDSEVGRTLLASGSLKIEALTGYAALVQRAVNEIRSLLGDKGTPEVRRAAGLDV